MAWQKPLRIVVAFVGLAVAFAVSFTMRERQVAPPPEPVARVDPQASIEITGSLLRNFTGTFNDFEVNPERWSFYPDGSKKAVGDPLKPWIVIRRGEARTFRIAAREATVSRDEQSFELFGPIRMEDSDGFWLQTDTATINRLDSIVHIPGTATFGKGRMSGSGEGLSYDEARQVLLISTHTQVKTVDESGKTVMQLSAETAMLDRMQHVLTADTGVHVVRNDQLIDADHANSRLGPNNDVVTFIELHGNSRVTGGAPVEAINARDVTLDYTDDGKTLEAVKMAGSASAAMVGDGGKPGLRIAGETVDLTLAADGKLTGIHADGNVRTDLPAGEDIAPRTITSQALDGSGEAGKGLTLLTFAKDVTYAEQALPAKGATAEKQVGSRIARAQTLEAAMADDQVSVAVFTGDVTVEETGLKACAARVEYQPDKGTLALSGATKAGRPMVADEQVAIEGQTMNVGLDTRRMIAGGGTITWMRSKVVNRCRPSRQRPAQDQGAATVPRLLKADAPVAIIAPALEYDSERGHAVFSGGRSTLDQDETSIAGERIEIDQTKGDLLVTGKADAQLMLDGKRTRAQAHEIRYVDQKRSIGLSSIPKTPGADVSLRSTADSDVRAGHIGVTLSATDNTMERMTAARNVRIVEGTTTVTGGASLDYAAASEEYVITGAGTTPVVAVTRSSDGCRRDSGNVIAFSRKTNRITVDGRGIVNADTDASTVACTPQR